MKIDVGIPSPHRGPWTFSRLNCCKSHGFLKVGAPVVAAAKDRLPLRMDRLYFINPMADPR
jgi:hypothetical protein